MKIRFYLAVAILYFAFLLTGCSHFDRVKMQDQALSGVNNSTSTVLYSKSFFQERFMGKEIGYQFIIGGNQLQYAFKNLENREGARLESGDFEKLLGDFDVAANFNNEFEKKTGKIKSLKIVLEKNSDKADQILEFIRYEKGEGKAPAKIFKPGIPLAAFKVSYGLGVKPGTEQIGLRKYYRPFIRIIGRIKLTGSDKVVWQNVLIVYGEKKYLGSDADASNIKKDELVTAFNQITKDIIDLLIKNLNGEDLPEMIDLQGANEKDNSF